MIKESKREINAFWSMKFLAFLLIFFHHTPTFNRFIRFPSLAVSFFIIISGYLNGITYFKKYNSFNFKLTFNFVKRKLQKIYPIHLIMFFVTVPLTGVFSYTSITQLYYWVKRAICNLTLTQSWINNQEYYFGFNGVTWYLSTYLFLIMITIPCLILIKKISQKSYSNIILISMTIFLFITDMIYVYFVQSNKLNYEFYLYILPVARVPEYLIGLIFGVISTRSKIIFCENKKIMWTLLEIIAAIPISTLIIFSPVRLGYFDMYFNNKINLWIIPIIIILLVYKNERGYISKIINNKLFVHLGKLSLVLFLIHQPIVSYISKTPINTSDVICRYITFLYILVLSIIISAMINRVLSIKKADSKE